MPVAFAEVPLPGAARSRWSVARPAGAPPDLAVPYWVAADGCVDLIARLTPAGCELLVAGPTSRAVSAELPPGVTLAGVQLRAGRAAGVLGFGPSELPGRLEPATRLGPRLADLAREVGRCNSAGEAGGLLADFAAAAPPAPADSLVAEALRLLDAGAAVGGLPRRLGTSARTLSRRLTAALGLRPKEYARLARFGRARELLGAPGITLARLALEAGYADQAHLANEFRRIAGVPPGRLRRG